MHSFILIHLNLTKTSHILSLKSKRASNQTKIPKLIISALTIYTRSIRAIEALITALITGITDISARI